MSKNGKSNGKARKPEVRLNGHAVDPTSNGNKPPDLAPDKHDTKSADEKKLRLDRIAPWRWKAGMPSPNPNGRPPSELCLTTITKEYGAAPAPKTAVQALLDRGVVFPTSWDKDKITMAQFTAARAWHNAAQVRGSQILKELYDRIDGKVPQPLRLTGPTGGPVQIRNFDLQKLTVEEALALRALVEKTAIDITEEQED
jgi:hypothetical protein